MLREGRKSVIVCDAGHEGVPAGGGGAGSGWRQGQVGEDRIGGGSVEGAHSYIYWAWEG